MPLAAGSIVAPNLRLVRRLGQGSMGSVWVAQHLTLHTEVAMKFIARELSSEARVRARFAREATAAAAIKSPHVVQMFDHGFTPDEMPFIVMELLEGEDLGKRLARGRRLDCGLVTQIVEQVCKALSKAHQVGIVHRDIKPENIFLADHDGELHVKVLDFGVAKHQNGEPPFALTSSGSFVGTPYYMSPEHILNAKAVDARSDLWSLGVVTYRALTGVRPFAQDNLAELVAAIDRGVYTPPTRLVPDLPPGVDEWFARVLNRNPAARFGSAREMAQALRSVVCGAFAGEPEPAPGQTPIANAAPAPIPTVIESPPAPSFAPAAFVSPPTTNGAATTPRRAAAAVVVGVVALCTVALAIAWVRGVRAPAAPAGPMAQSAATAAPDATSAPELPLSIPSSTPESVTTFDAPSASASAPLPAPRTTAAPTRAVTPRIETKATNAPARASGVDTACDPPYRFDAEGNRHFKPGCFSR